MNRAENTISVRHVSVAVDKTFEETCSRFESRMGHLDYGAFDEQLTYGMSEGAARDYMKNIEGWCISLVDGHHEFVGIRAV